MKLKIILLFVFNSYSIVLLSQQDPVYSQYMFNLFAVNPAYAGSQSGLNGAFMYRKQWVGLTGGPEVQSFTVNGPVNYNRIGLGFQVLNQTQNIYSQLSANFAYAYKINCKKGILSFGLYGGIKQVVVDYSKLLIKDPDDRPSEVKSLLPDFGAGVHYQKGKYYLDFSIRHLMSKSKASQSFQSAPNYYLTGAYKFVLSDTWSIIPSSYFKWVNGAPLQFDITLQTIYRNMAWAGFSYRTLSAMSFQTGINVSKIFNMFYYQIKLGYAYDLPYYNDIKIQSRGTHELIAIIDLRKLPSIKKLKKKDVTISPLYF